MENIKQLTDSELDEIISGSVDGVYPTSQEVSMASELKTSRYLLAAHEPVAYMCDGADGREYNGHNEFSCGCRGVPLYSHPAPLMPENLHPDTKKLVTDFSVALAEKLYKAQLKYGYEAGWNLDGWQSQCQAHFHQHIAKGDPRDVAAYCAFMWFHGWSTTLPANCRW